MPPSLSSILTIRPAADPNPTFDAAIPATTLDNLAADSRVTFQSEYSTKVVTNTDSLFNNLGTTNSMLSIDSFHTAQALSTISTAAATEGGSTIQTLPLVHRFTLIKPGVKKTSVGGIGARNGSPPSAGRLHSRGNGNVGSQEPHVVGWNPLDLFFSSGLLGAKCDLCLKRLGWKPVLECDDCGLR
jgi:LIM domain kinase 1